MLELKLSPPWITYVNEVKALFGEDPEIKIEYEYKYEDACVNLDIRVDNTRKTLAIIELLPDEVDFGNVVVNVNIIPTNADDLEEGWEEEFKSPADVFEAAFRNNPVFAFVKTIPYIFTNTITYVVFKNRVVQFFNDNLGDIYGNVSTLYQYIAEDLFEEYGVHGVYYCTDVETAIKDRPERWP